MSLPVCFVLADGIVLPMWKLTANLSYLSPSGHNLDKLIRPMCPAYA